MSGVGRERRISSLHGVRLRIRQFRSAFGAADREVDATLRGALPNQRLWRLVERMSDYDRRHACEAYSCLISHGVQDADLLHSAILHDIGKADERGRVRLFHRVVWVLGRRTAPQLVRRFASSDGGWIRHGLYLAAHHAALGSQLARGAGASERCCELIARHEETPPTGDAVLDTLIAADEGGLS